MTVIIGINKSAKFDIVKQDITSTIKESITNFLQSYEKK